MDKTREVLNKIQDAMTDATAKVQDAVLDAYGTDYGRKAASAGDNEPMRKVEVGRPLAHPAELRQARCDRVFEAAVRDDAVRTTMGNMLVSEARAICNAIADALYKAGMFRG